MHRSLRVPHTLVLLFAMMLAAWLATWLLPQGRFDTTETAEGRSLVVPGSYTPAPERVRLPPSALLTAVPRALAAAQDIVFFVLLVGGTVSVLRATGAIDAFLGWALRRAAGRPNRFIVAGMTAFAAGSSALGMAEEYIPVTAMVVALGTALGLAPVASVGVLMGGCAIGYGVAALNPFTVQIAQGIAELPPTSGLRFRLALFLPFIAIGAHHVWRHARRSPIVPDPPGPAETPNAAATYPTLDGRRRLVALIALATLLLMVGGIATAGWYLTELGALFLGLAMVAGAVGRLGADATARRFAEGAADLAPTALLIGFARSIALILEDGQVLHTVVHGLSQPLQHAGPHVAAVGMLLIQTVLNLFIPSGSGQAFVTMPIMTPLGDLLGLDRQVVVLAYQFGDGFSNLIVPTNIVLMSILGIAGVPYDRWVRFAFPLLLKLVAAGAVSLGVANVTGMGP
ncbi:MAG: YfcC family protein [Verrucomicrobiae bacterium]|nr:YfcC family protein [Verrucomicrobiae bacterium]